MKFTRYFEYRSKKSDREWIKPEWIELAMNKPEAEEIQSDGRIKRWARIKEAKTIGGCALFYYRMAKQCTMHSSTEHSRSNNEDHIL